MMMLMVLVTMMAKAWALIMIMMMKALLSYLVSVLSEREQILLQVENISPSPVLLVSCFRIFQHTEPGHPFSRHSIYGDKFFSSPVNNSAFAKSAYSRFTPKLGKSNLTPKVFSCPSQTPFQLRFQVLLQPLKTLVQKFYKSDHITFWQLLLDAIVKSQQYLCVKQEERLNPKLKWCLFNVEVQNSLNLKNCLQ